MMKRIHGTADRLRPWELALLIALCFTLCAGMAADRTQEELAGRLIRLHIVANSDAPSDQAEKLQLRDRVLAFLAPLLRDCADPAEAAGVILAHRAELEALGADRVQLGREYYPTRQYGRFSLPAGEYLSLRLVMGEGRGKNWWCVLFPPLCTEVLAEPAAEEAFLSLTEQERALITRDGPVYALGFRLAEWWGMLEERFSVSSPTETELPAPVHF